MRKTRVLFLCTGNSARSQMAEAFLRRYGGDRFDSFSAGLEPKGINPYTVEVMEEIGFDLSEQRSKNIQEYMFKTVFGYVITVCSRAEQNCPVLPGITKRLHWPFDDPAECRGSNEDCLAEFRRVRDEIEERVKSWVAETETV